MIYAAICYNLEKMPQWKCPILPHTTLWIARKSMHHHEAYYGIVIASL
jgi:hypothetical protein